MKIDYRQIENLLPQTQCGDCTYPGCKPYAVAIAEHGELINRCLPGGLKTLHAIAELMGMDAKPLEAELLPKIKSPALAKIREDECIGCTKCIQACPVDAIVGSAKMMHSIINQECTGCGLCVEPCPVDCIDLFTLAEVQYDPELAQRRYAARQERILAEDKTNHPVIKQSRQDYIRAAMLRVEKKRK